MGKYLNVLSLILKFIITLFYIFCHVYSVLATNRCIFETLFIHTEDFRLIIVENNHIFQIYKIIDWKVFTVIVF